MRPVVVDADVLYGTVEGSAARADDANAIVGGISRGTLPVAHIITPVLQEAIKHVQNERGWHVGRSTLEFYSSEENIRIVHPSEEDVERGRAIYRRHRNLEFTDGIIVAYMRERGIDHLYSFTARFDEFTDLTRLTTADNPFP